MQFCFVSVHGPREPYFVDEPSVTFALQYSVSTTRLPRWVKVKLSLLLTVWAPSENTCLLTEAQYIGFRFSPLYTRKPLLYVRRFRLHLGRSELESPDLIQVRTGKDMPSHISGRSPSRSSADLQSLPLCSYSVCRSTISGSGTAKLHEHRLLVCLLHLTTGSFQILSRPSVITIVFPFRPTLYYFWIWNR
jgi:hypothetical protein